MSFELALGFEITIISTDLDNHGKWIIEKKTWMEGREAIETTECLYGACVNIKVIVEDVSINYNFFVQEKSFLPNHSRSTLYHFIKNGDEGYKQRIRSQDERIPI